MRPARLAALLALLAGPAAAAEPAPRPAIVSAAEWGSKPQPIPAARKHTPKFVTIHHAGVLWKAQVTPDVFVRNMQSWGQQEKGWPDLPYHFLIAPDGTMYEGRPLAFEPESNTKYPLAGNIGVEMMGNFEEPASRPAPGRVVREADGVALRPPWDRPRDDPGPQGRGGRPDELPRQGLRPLPEGRPVPSVGRGGSRGQSPRNRPGPAAARRPRRADPDGRPERVDPGE